MNCLKCKKDGLYKTTLYLTQEAYTLDVFKCIYCGDTIDKLILENRLKSKPPPS